VGRTNSAVDFSDSRYIFGTSAAVDAYVSKLGSDLSQHFATAILASNDWDEAHALPRRSSRQTIGTRHMPLRLTTPATFS